MFKQKNINEKKRGENILKVQKLEKQQKENAEELDKLIQQKTNNVLYKGDKKVYAKKKEDHDKLNKQGYDHDDPKTKKIDRCRVCGNLNLQSIFSIGDQ